MNKLLLYLLLLLSPSIWAQSNERLPMAIEVPGSGFQFINAQTNKPISPLFWDEAEPFVNGFSRVLSKGKFTFVNTQGQPIAPVSFDEARNFEHKLAAVKTGGKWGFINESGKLIIPNRYDIVYDFKENVSPVYNGKKWSLLNSAGIVVKNLDISVCYGFQNGQARITAEGKTGIMNTNGDITFTGVEPVTETATRSNVPATNDQVVTQCPDNIDFEDGNFTNWRCFTGRVDSVGPTNVITVNPSAPINNRHTIIGRNLPSNIDPFGLFPINPPDGSNFAVKLGNTNIGAQAERIQYTIHVPTNDSNFSIKYDYAVVFQDPGHTAWTQPRFIARLFDSAANSYVSCASFEYISTSSLPGFARSTVDTSVIYKPWSTVFISLRGYAGKTLFLEFTNADCVRKGHWGYAYVDVEKTCSQNILIRYDCGNPSTATLQAPPGFMQYNWWNHNYTTLLGTGQNIILNPAPSINSIVWLEMIPFSDFGCRDSMPVRMTASFQPHFTSSATTALCAPHRFTFYNADVPALSTTWDFGDGTTGTGDTVTHTFLLPGTYTVTMHVTLAGGCNGTTTNVITITQPTGSFNYTGGSFCNSRQVRFNAVTSNIDSLVWDFGDGTIITTTQTTIFHTYTNPGVYLPSLTIRSNAGCETTIPGTDPIKIEVLQPGFTYREQISCGSNTVNFTDTSHAYFGINDHDWNFGDGSTGSGTNVTHTYTSTGTYQVQLIITGSTGCKDTIVKPVFVRVYAIPVVNINPPGSVCANTSVTLTSVIQSTDTVDMIEWTAPGQTSGAGANYTITYANPGTYPIQLIIETNHGCRDTAVQSLTVRAIPDVVQPNDQFVCNGTSTDLVNFTGSVNNTTFSWANNNPSIGLADSGTGNIPVFTGTNNTNSDQTATITVTPDANGCPGTPVSFNITVYPTPSVMQPANQVVCNRGTTTGINFTNFTSVVTNAAYSWTNNTPSIGLASSGFGNIPSFTAINNTNTPLTATIHIQVINNGCPGTPRDFTITVNPTPDVAQPANQAICNGSSSSPITFSGAVNNTSFTWTNDVTSIGLAATGNGNIATFNAINLSNAPVTAHITVTPMANTCAGSPESFNITVNPIPTVNQPATQSVCNGALTNAVDFTGAVAGTNYTWTNDQTSIGLPANGTGDIPAFNGINNGISPVTATITVSPEFSSCPGTSKSFRITVLPLANLIQPMNQFLCNGEPSAPINFMGTTSGTTYSWTNDNPSIGLAATGNGNIPSFTVTNSGNTTATANITVTATANNCGGVTRTFQILIDPTPDMAQPANQTVCNGGVINPTAFVGTVAGTTFSWINNTTSIGLSASGTGDVPSFTAINNTHFPVTAIISVTGFANSCTSVTKVYTITVNPTPEVDAPLSQEICNGGTTQPVAFTSPVSGTVFSWTNSNPSIGLAANGTGNLPAFTAINNTTSDITATITVSGSQYNCNSSDAQFTITIHPTPVITASNPMNVCLGSSVNLSASGAAQYNWNPATDLSCTNCPNPVATPHETGYYAVAGTSSFGCIGNDTVYLIVIKPFQMQVSPNDTICAGQSITLKASGAATYLWSPAISLNRPDIAEPTALPTATTPYRVIGYDAYNCFKDTGYVTITVGPNPTVNIGPDIHTTTGAVITLHPVTTNGPIVEWAWTPATGLSCDNCESPVMTVKGNTAYSLTVTNSFGCVANDNLQVGAFCESAQTFIPNAFTPDGDGLNDILMVRGTGITVKSFRIFNRWGILVFEKLNFQPNDPKFGWDGKVKGVAASPDVFVYTAEVVCDNGIINTYKGNTTILK